MELNPKAIDRNAACPCGSGRKFKKCHMGRENELSLLLEERAKDQLKALLGLKEVNYGRSEEFRNAIDLRALTGVDRVIKFVDLQEYLEVSGRNLFGGDGLKKSGGLVINPWKTSMIDHRHVWVAISEDITDSALIHELAHVLDYLGGAKVMPWVAYQLSNELDIPVEHLEHLEEFGYWLDWLLQRFDVELDADDTIVHYLYKKGLLIKAGDIILGDREGIKNQSKRILEFLSENSQEIARLIREKKGYRGVKHGDLEGPL